jgi:hypothetical protein
VFPANQYERRQLQLYQEAGLPLIATATAKNVIYIYAAPNQDA